MFYSIFRANPIPTVVLLPDSPLFTILDANDAFCCITNTKPDFLIHQSIFQAFPVNPFPLKDDNDEKFKNGLSQVLASRKELHLAPTRHDVYNSFTGTSDERYWSRSIIPILEEDGTIEALMVTTVDDTIKFTLEKDRKVAEAGLVERENQLSRIYDTVADVIFVVSYLEPDTFRFESVNNEFSVKTGLPYESVVGCFVQDIIPEASFAMVKTNYLKAIAERRQISWVEVTEYPTGTKTAEVTVSPVFDDFDQCIQLVGAVHDITEMVDAQNETQRLLEIKDEFLNIASHELKTPLTSIKAYTQVLLKCLDKVNPAYNFAVKIHQSVRKLQDLTSNLLDVTKINAGKLVVNKEPLSLIDFLRENMESAQCFTTSHSIHSSDIVKATFNGERYRLDQVMQNLLSNAVKYSPDAKTVNVFAEVKQAEIIISVQDFGIGIKPEHQDKLFTQFYRIADTSTRFNGLGLGLFICYKIIKEHGGEMGVKSSLGLGSTFWFSLPRY